MTSKIVYLFDGDSKEHIGQSCAFKSPEVDLEPDLFHMPANSTDAEPPIAQEGKAIVFNADTGLWGYVDNIRGVWYNKDGSVINVDSLTYTLPADASREKPVIEEVILPEPTLTFEQEYQKKYAQIYAVRDAFIYPTQGIEYLGTIFDLDEKSYLNLTQVCASVTLLGRLPESFAWINKANQPITMTLEQFKGLVDVATARFQQGYADALAKKTALALCTTIADIQALQ